MEKEILSHLQAQDEKLDAIYKSVEKTRKYFLTVLFISVAALIFPLIIIILIIPFFLKTITSFGGLL